MQAREDFHKAGFPAKASFRGILAALTLVSLSCADSGDAETERPPRVSAAEPSASVTERTPPAGYAWVIFGADTVVAEVAASEEERAEGLMYRESVPDGTGMLFVFPDSQIRSFWMANTYVALDIAYMDPSYRIVDVIAMEPLVTDSYPSSAPAMFALEVRQGWFEEQGIGTGDQAEIVFGVRR